MKAVFLNTMFSLLCFAGIVLAAPHQSMPVAETSCIYPEYAATCAVETGRRPCRMSQKPEIAAPVTHDSDSFLSW